MIVFLKQVKKIMMPSCCASVMLLLVGCSSMFGDNNRVVHIDSQPKDAKVLINNVEIGNKTPTDIVVSHMFSPTVITVEKPGCDKKTVTIDPEFQKIGFLNILVFPGFIVDAITGDMMKVPEHQRQIHIDAC